MQMPYFRLLMMSKQTKIQGKYIFTKAFKFMHENMYIFSKSNFTTVLCKQLYRET